MTKKTNSLLIRYGINTLWKNKSSSHAMIEFFLQLDKLISVWLKKKNMNLLDIRYKANFLYVFLYNQFFFDDKFKSEIIKYYKKILNVELVIQRFGIAKYQLKWIFLTNNILKINFCLKASFKSLFFYNLFCLLYKLFFIRLLFMVVKFLMLPNSFTNSFLFTNWIFIFSKTRVFIKGKPIYFFNSNFNLKKANGFLKLKIVSKGLENLIYRLKKFPMNVKLNNVFLQKGLPRISFFGNQTIKPDFRFKFFTIFLSIVYNNSLILATYLAVMIKNGKQHRKNLQTFTDFFERVFFSCVIFLSGFQLRVTGKLGGKLRKSKYHYKLGKVKLQTFKHFLSYSLVPSFTKFGVISIKVWLL